MGCHYRYHKNNVYLQIVRNNYLLMFQVTLDDHIYSTYIKKKVILWKLNLNHFSRLIPWNQLDKEFLIWLKEKPTLQLFQFQTTETIWNFVSPNYWFFKGFR